MKKRKIRCTAVVFILMFTFFLQTVPTFATQNNPKEVQSAYNLEVLDGLSSEFIVSVGDGRNRAHIDGSIYINFSWATANSAALTFTNFSSHTVTVSFDARGFTGGHTMPELGVWFPLQNGTVVINPFSITSISLTAPQIINRILVDMYFFTPTAAILPPFQVVDIRR